MSFIIPIPIQAGTQPDPILKLKQQLAVLTSILVDYDLDGGVRLVTLGKCPTALVSLSVFNPDLFDGWGLEIVERDHGDDGTSYTARFIIEDEQYDITSWRDVECGSL